MSNSDVLQTGDIIRRTIAVAGGNFLPLVVIALLIYVPVVLVGVVTALVLGGAGGLGNLESMDPSMLSCCLLPVIAILFVLLMQVQAGAFAFGIFEALRGRPVRVGSCLRIALSRAFHMVVAAILVILCAGVGFVFFIAPGLVILTGLSMVIPILVVERLGVIDSLDRSWDLTRGHKWRIFVLALIWFLFSAAVGLVIQKLGLQPLWVEQPIRFVMSVFSATAITLIYHDLRQIKDGLGTDDLVAVFE